MPLEPLPDLILEPLVRMALAEDLGRAGDITTNATIPADRPWSAALVARKAGVIAGMDLARLAFHAMDHAVVWAAKIQDGTTVQAGTTLSIVKSSARGLLAAERTALNFLCHLSGIATQTKSYVEAVAHTKTRICDTRKTTPGLRAVEKYAVRAGGGLNHRFGLDDAVLIKDNHIAVAGSVTAAVRAAREAVGHMVTIELEVDNLEQLREALANAVLPDSILLDNMEPRMVREAVGLVARRCITLASGGITLANVAAYAEAGVDRIAIGSLTHSASILDIGLDDAAT